MLYKIGFWNGAKDRTNRTHIAHTHVTRTHTGAYTYGRTHIRTYAHVCMHVHTRKCNETMYKRKKYLQKISKIKAFCLLGKYE